MASTFLQPYKIVITRFFFPVLYFKLLRKIYGTYDQIFGMCASINNKNHNYKLGKSFITQNHLLMLWKKHREKGCNTGKTQGILSRLECGHPDLGDFRLFGHFVNNLYFCEIEKSFIPA